MPGLTGSNYAGLILPKAAGKPPPPPHNAGPAKGVRYPQGLDHPASGFQSLKGVTGSYKPQTGLTSPAHTGARPQPQGLRLNLNAPGAQKTSEEGRRGALGLREQGSLIPEAPIATAVKAATAITGTPSNATFLGRVVNSGINTIAGGIPAAKEAVEHPIKTLEGLKHVVEHPWASFKENPVGVALIARAPYEAAGRIPSALTRGSIGSLDRTPLHVYGQSTGASTDQITSGLHDVSIPRSYSPNIINKGAQVAAENFKSRVLKQNPNVASTEQAQRLLYGGGLLGQHVFKPVQGFFKPGLVDRQAGLGEMMRRAYTRAAAQHMKSIQPKVGAEAVPLAVEGIVRRPETLIADLQKEHARLQDTAAGLTGREAKFNKANQQQIEKLLADDKFLANPHPAFEAARQYAAWSRPIEDRLVQLGHLEPDQLHARNMSYALAHMGAIYNKEPGAHPLVGVVADTERAVKQAQSDLRGAIAKRKAAEIAHPSAGTTTDLARARTALRQAEGARGEAKGRLGPQLHSLGREQAVKDARAAYRAAKEQHVMEHSAKVEAAKQRLLDAHGARTQAADELQRLKEMGAIKASGEMYPRLERAGQPLKADVIEAHMAKNLEDRNVAFLTHKAEQSYGKSLQSYAGKRPGTAVTRRTGVAFQQGTYDRSFEGLRKQAYDNVNKIAGNENFDEMLRRFGIGRFADEGHAARALDNFRHTPEGQQIENALGKMTIQRVGPDRVVGRRNVETRALGPAIHDFGLAEHKAIQEVTGSPKYTLLPEVVAKRIREHDALNNPGPGARTLQWYTNKWRSATLYTSPRWMLGSPQEHAIRLAMGNVNPAAIFGVGSRSLKIGHALLDEWHRMASDESLTEQQRYVARAHVAAYRAGTHYGSIAVNAVHREAGDLAQTSMSRDLATAFDETTPVSRMIAGWDKWKGAIGKGMAAVERNSQAAAVGKMALKEQTTFGRDWRGLIARQDKAVHDYAQGKLAPNEAAKLGNDIMEMMGNWTLLTPKVRQAVQTYSPFGLWWLNSMKFVFRTLPRDHPFKTAAFAAMEAGTGQEAKLAKAKSYLAGGFGATLPIVGHVTLTPGYYSPFGIATEAGKTFADQILPQISQPLGTIAGFSQFKGEALKNAQGEPLDLTHRLALAGREVGEGTVPGLRQLVQFGQQGGKPEPGSLNPLAVKPGTQRGVPTTLVKMFSPLRMTLGAKEAKGGRERKLPERTAKERERKLPERAVRER